MSEDAMPYQAVPNCIGVEIRQTYYDEPFENTFYYEWGGTEPDEDALEALCVALADVWDELAPPLLSTAWSITSIYARLLDFEVAPEFTRPIISTAGSVTGDGMPTWVAAVVSRLSGLTGRSNRGRVYVAGIPKTATVNNQITTTLRNGLQELFTTMDAAAAELTYTPVIVSRYADGVARPTGVKQPLLTWQGKLRLGKRSSRDPLG